MRRTRDPELAADLAAETFAVALVGVAQVPPRRRSGIRVAGRDRPQHAVRELAPLAGRGPRAAAAWDGADHARRRAAGPDRADRRRLAGRRAARAADPRAIRRGARAGASTRRPTRRSPSGCAARRASSASGCTAASPCCARSMKRRRHDRIPGPAVTRWSPRLRAGGVVVVASCGASVPTFAVAAALVALVSFPHVPRERERAVTPPPPTATPQPYAKQTLAEAFSVFRRKPTRADRLPVGGQFRGWAPRRRPASSSRAVRGASSRPRSRPGEGESVCVIAVRRGRWESSDCASAAEAIDEATPLWVGVEDISGAFLPDSSRDLRFLLPNGTGSVSPSSNLYARQAVRAAGRDVVDRRVGDALHPGLRNETGGACPAAHDLPEAPARAAPAGRARQGPPRGTDRRRPLLPAGEDRDRGRGGAGDGDAVLEVGHGALDRRDAAGWCRRMAARRPRAGSYSACRTATCASCTCCADTAPWRTIRHSGVRRSMTVEAMPGSSPPSITRSAPARIDSGTSSGAARRGRRRGSRSTGGPAGRRRQRRNGTRTPSVSGSAPQASGKRRRGLGRSSVTPPGSSAERARVRGPARAARRSRGRRTSPPPACRAGGP